MGSQEHAPHLDTDSTASLAEKADRLLRFVGPMEERDREIVAHWRSASPEEHAQAMIELSDYAEMMVAHTGLIKDKTDMFPGFCGNKLRSK